MDADRADRLVDAGRGGRRRGRARRRSSAASRSHGDARLRDRLPQRPRRRLRRRWRRVALAGRVRRSARSPTWYAPFGIQAIGGHVFVTYVCRAPVERQRRADRRLRRRVRPRRRLLVARVARGGALNAPWGLALAPRSFGRFGGDLLVGNFGDGRINAYRRAGTGWALDGALHERDGKPLVGQRPLGDRVRERRRCGRREHALLHLRPARVARARPSSACTACSARSRPA